MSIKMMNGVEVYDKQDVDGIVETINTTSAQHTTDIQQLNQNKAEKTYAQETRQIANDAKNAIGDDDQHGLRGRIKAVENAIGSNNNTSSIEGRLDYLETHSVTVEDLSQQLTGKADKNYTQQTRQIANNNSSSISALENRTTALENGKADKSEIPGAVSSAVDGIINTKLALITSNINSIVDNEIASELQGYDDSNAVNSKINAAVATRPVAMSTAEATAIVNQYF